jgi:tetratricopeptide (TPR) repeat protein
VSVASGHGIDEWGVVDALMSLARKSMVGTDAGPGGVTRYTLLETLRQYARERLQVRVEIDVVRRRHATYYAQLAGRLGVDLITDREVAAQEAALAELDNLRTAVAWSLDSEADADVQFAVLIVAELALFANTAKSCGLGSWAERAAGHLDGAELGLRVAVFGAAAANALQRGDFVASAGYAQRAVADGIPAGCPRSAMAQAVSATALAATEVTESFSLLRGAIEELERLGEVWGVLNLELVTVILWSVIGDVGSAQQEIGPLLSRARRLGNPTNLIIALYAFASAWWRENPADALVALEESLSLGGKGGSDVVLENSYLLLGQIRDALGDVSGALAAFRSAIEMADRFGNRPAVVGILRCAIEVLNTSRAHEVAALCIGLIVHGPLAAAAAGLWLRDEGGTVAHGREEARVALGQHRFDELVGQGAAMTYEGGIAWARTARATQSAAVALDR